jgi:protein-tyrosine phosphatase
VTLRSGPYPVESQLADDTTLFVDLTEEGELRPYAHLLPPGSRHVRAPIADFGVPGEEQMAAALDLIDDALAAGDVVYVHCRAGVGRTRTVIGCHRRRHGLDPGLEPETGAQRAFVRAWPEGR